MQRMLHNHTKLYRIRQKIHTQTYKQTYLEIEIQIQEETNVHGKKNTYLIRQKSRYMHMRSNKYNKKNKTNAQTHRDKQRIK